MVVSVPCVTRLPRPRPRPRPRLFFRVAAQTYEFSKLKKFLLVARFMMEDTLRFLVEESAARFAGFVQGCCAAKVLVNATNQVRHVLLASWCWWW